MEEEPKRNIFVCTTSANSGKLVCPTCNLELIFDMFKALAATYAGVNKYGLHCPDCSYNI